MIEAALISLVAGVLQGVKGWQIKRRRSEPRSDLIVESPSGRLFTIEVKSGTGSAHFGALAQAQRFAFHLSSIEGQEVFPVLITTQSVSQEIAHLADEAGVELIQISDDEHRGQPSDEDVEASVTRFLETHG